MSGALAWSIILASIVLNAFFAGVETGFTSARRVRLEHWARRGSRPARWAARIAARREDAVIGAVVGNNVAVVFGTSIATAYAVQELGAVGETVAAVAMASVNIVFGEILPKTFYRSRPERAVVWSTPLFVGLIGLMWPVRALAIVAARGILWLLGLRQAESEGRLDRAGLRHLFAVSREAAGLDAQRDRLLSRFLDHAHRPLRSVMTPLERVTCVPRGFTAAEIRDVIRRTGHSRVPVVDEHGNLVGLFVFHDLAVARTGFEIGALVRELLRLPAPMALDEAIAALTHRQASMAAVVDADGRSVGIVTLEDLLEPLVGEIVDEHDRPASG